MEEGVAAFENKIYEYHRAGGPAPVDSEMKSDLVQILPQQIREQLLWHSTNVGVDYQTFRNTVCAQTQSVLLEQKPRRQPVQAVEEPASAADTLLRMLNGSEQDEDGSVDDD